MTSADAIEELYKHLVASPLKTAVSGGIYKMQRPTGSTKEDVVINCLGMTGEQLQRGVLNVNIHVADKQQSIAGQPQKMPDFARLKALSAIAESEVEEHKGSFWFGVEGDRLFKDEGDQHYCNIRIEFYALNF